MKLSSQQQIFTSQISCLIQFANSIGVELTFGEAQRTYSQGLLNYFGYKVERDGSTIHLVKKRRSSWTLRSKHLDRMAIDFNYFIDGKIYYKHPKINEIGKYWCDMDKQNEWGGNWLDSKGNQKDTPHYQRNKI